MNKFTKTLALILLGTSVTHVHSLTENTRTGISIGGGAVAGVITSAMVYTAMDRNQDYRTLATIGAGLGVAGVTGLVLYYALGQFTPTARVAQALRIINAIEQHQLGNEFDAKEELFSYATGRYHVRWPIAEGHEHCIALLGNLNAGLVLLNLAAADAPDAILMNEIERLSRKISPLSKILQKNANLFQSHDRYEIQATLLEGHRREQRMEAKAEERHQQAMAQQQAIHMQAMAQQAAIHRPADYNQRRVDPYNKVDTRMPYAPLFS